jgi:hypothetical protein
VSCIRGERRIRSRASSPLTAESARLAAQEVPQSSRLRLPPPLAADAHVGRTWVYAAGALSPSTSGFFVSLGGTQRFLASTRAYSV